MSFVALFKKEAYDLVRDKRFGAWALTLATVWAVIVVIAAVSVRMDVQRQNMYPTSVLEPAIAYYITGGISLVILSLFVGADGVCREREAGTLPLVCATPVKRSDVILAKLASAGLAYVGAIVVTLVSASVLALIYGPPTLTLIMWMYAAPFLVLWIFLAGVGLLIGVAFSSSKAAIGTGAAIYIPLLLLGRPSPFEELYREYPQFARFAEFTPFSATYNTFDVILRGGTIPWGPVALTVALGAAAAVAAFVLFTRQEGAL